MSNATVRFYWADEYHADCLTHIDYVSSEGEVVSRWCVVVPPAALPLEQVTP